MYADQFTLNTARVGDGAYVVSVSGELDLHTVGRLEAELEQAIAHGARRVLADLACVTFMDSTALGAIVAAQRTLRSSGGDLVVVSNDPRVVRLFAITGLDQVLRTYPSLTDAIDELVTAAG